MVLAHLRGELAQALERLVAGAAHVVRDHVEARQLLGEDLTEGGGWTLHHVSVGIWSSTNFRRSLRLGQAGGERGPEFGLHGGVAGEVLEAVDLLHAGRARHVDQKQPLFRSS